jgi:hypothetical protein
VQYDIYSAFKLYNNSLYLQQMNKADEACKITFSRCTIKATELNFYYYCAYSTFVAEETAETVQVNVVSHNWPEAPHHHHKVKLLPVVEDFLDSRTPMSLLPVLPLFLPPYLFHPSSSLKLKRLPSLRYKNHHR